MKFIDSVARDIANTYDEPVFFNDLYEDDKLRFLKAAIRDEKFKRRNSRFDNISDFVTHNSIQLGEEVSYFLEGSPSGHDLWSSALLNIGKKVIENAIDYIRIDIDKALEAAYIKIYGKYPRKPAFYITSPNHG